MCKESSTGPHREETGESPWKEITWKEVWKNNKSMGYQQIGKKVQALCLAATPHPSLTNGQGPSSSPGMGLLVKPNTWYCFPMPIESVSLLAAFSISSARSEDACDFRASTRTSIPIRFKKSACDMGPWVKTGSGLSGVENLWEERGIRTQARNCLPEECEIYICSQVTFSGLMEHVYEFVVFESLGKPDQVQQTWRGDW